MAEDEGIYKGYFNSPVGLYQIQADADGITSIELIRENEKSPNSSPSASKQSSKHIEDCLQWMTVYFKDPAKTNKSKIPRLNTTKFKHRVFCQKVWKVVREKVGPGQTITYGEVAKLADNPNGARAVGMAMKCNPLSIIMPCHRVVNSKGGLGNYSSLNGVETKKWLLKHEGVDVKKLA